MCRAGVKRIHNQERGIALSILSVCLSISHCVFDQFHYETVLFEKFIVLINENIYLKQAKQCSLWQTKRVPFGPVFNLF